MLIWANVHSKEVTVRMFYVRWKTVCPLVKRNISRINVPQFMFQSIIKQHVVATVCCYMILLANLVDDVSEANLLLINIGE